MAQWLRHCAKNLKFACSIPDVVIGIFHWYNPSERTMALGSTQSLTEMSTRRIFWGKGGRCVRLTNLPHSCAVVMKSGNLNFREPSGPLQACNGTVLPLPLEGGEGSVSGPGRFLPPGKTRYPWYRRLGGPQGGSGRRKISPHRDSIPRPSSP